MHRPFVREIEAATNGAPECHVPLTVQYRYAIRPLRISIGVTLPIAVLLTGAFNAISLNEAYGDGPPYCARSANMAKWTNRLPLPGMVDGAMLVAIAAYRSWLRRSR